MLKSKRPKEVRLLEAGDICRNVAKKHYANGEIKQCCLLGWMEVEFGRVTNAKVKAVNKAILEVSLNVRYSPKSSQLTIDFNDNVGNNESLIARVWNRAMYLLGYVVNNPESKPLTGRNCV